MKISTFLQSALTLSLVVLTPLAAQEDDPFVEDPFAKSKNTDPEAALLKVISVAYEAFSLSLAEAAALHREGLQDNALYQRMLDGLETGAVIQEHFALLRTQPGQQVVTESIVERIYPTQYEAPVQPESVSLTLATTPTKTEAALSSPLPGSPTPATAVTFETKNIGLTLKMEAFPASESNYLDVRLEPTIIHYSEPDSFGKGISQVTISKFEVQRSNNNLTLKVGEPMLLGTLSQPPNSQRNSDAASQVWLTFVAGRLLTVK